MRLRWEACDTWERRQATGVCVEKTRGRAADFKPPEELGWRREGRLLPEPRFSSLGAVGVE